MSLSPGPFAASFDLTGINPAIDLDAAPYSARFSRLLVLSADGMATSAGRERLRGGSPEHGDGNCDAG